MAQIFCALACCCAVRLACVRAGTRRRSAKASRDALRCGNEAAARVKVETIKEVTAALSAKEMEGRGTAQPGGDRAAKYIADRFAKLGLKPLGDAGTFLQAIKFNSTQPLAESSFKVRRRVAQVRRGVYPRAALHVRVVGGERRVGLRYLRRGFTRTQARRSGRNGREGQDCRLDAQRQAEECGCTMPGGKPAARRPSAGI